MKAKRIGLLVVAFALTAIASSAQATGLCWRCEWDTPDQPRCAFVYASESPGSGRTQCEAYTREPGTEGPVGCRLSGGLCPAPTVQPIWPYPEGSLNQLNEDTDIVIAALNVWMGTEQVVNFIQDVDEQVAALPAEEHALARYDAYLVKVTQLTGIEHKRGDYPIAAPRKV